MIEDDPDTRFLNRRLIEKAFPHAVVMESETCEDALAQAAGRTIDAVIADYTLRGRTGIECLELLRGSGVRGPIVLVTGSTDPNVRAKALAAGADAVFSGMHGDFVAYLQHALSPA